MYRKLRSDDILHLGTDLKLVTNWQKVSHRNFHVPISLSAVLRDTF